MRKWIIFLPVAEFASLIAYDSFNSYKLSIEKSMYIQQLGIALVDKEHKCTLPS